MTQNHNSQRDRRVLSLPAVHPCEGISPSTLLASLITLSQNICNYQHSFFATQKRNAREAMRQVGLILIFLQEIQDRAIPIHDNIILSFSELHFTFQKLHSLMQDCTREGARLLMLAKSQHVTSLFQSLIRAMATSLDVLPLYSVEVCSEVKELVQLVAKQARKAKLEVHPKDKDKDKRASKRVHSILRHFEKGIEPDVNAMKGILDYLEIKSWSDCNREINFIQEEIGFEYDDERGNEREVPLLSSLVGFLTYCRVVLFERIETLELNQSEARFSTEITSSYAINPEDFRCPISLELMTDPVTVSTGQTYDRSSIKKWLKAGNLTCPKTGEKLINTELVPNTTLKRLIQQFCADNGISLTKSCNHRNRDIITRTTVPGSSAAAHAMQFLSWFLTRTLVFGTEEKKNKAAYEIRVLARSNMFNRACLIEVGTVPPLLDLLETNDRSTQENAISSLLKLSKHASSGPENIMESGGLKQILKVLKHGLSLEARQIAAATIFYLSSVKEYRRVIGENPDAIPGLVDLINEGTQCGKKNAVVAIFGLLLLPRNHQRVLESGAVPVILGVLGSMEKDELITECLSVLAVLAESVNGANALLQCSTSALKLITGRMLQSATSRAGKEHCTSILLSLCVNVGSEVVAVLANDPSLMPLLYSLLTVGTTNAAKKARFLIQILQDFKETRASELKGSNFLASTGALFPSRLVNDE